MGMSKDSPFHTTGYTKTHPSSKQILDYGDKKKRNLPHDMSSLSIEA